MKLSSAKFEFIPRCKQRGIRTLIQAKGTPIHELRLKVPEGYVVSLQTGPDFVVRRVRKISPLGTLPPTITIYLGGSRSS